MSDTPRTDAVWKAWTTDDPDCDRIAFMSEHANTLERENAALREKVDQLTQFVREVAARVPAHVAGDGATERAREILREMARSQEGR